MSKSSPSIWILKDALLMTIIEWCMRGLSKEQLRAFGRAISDGRAAAIANARKSV